MNNGAVSNSSRPLVRLGEIFQRLEPLCRRLWDENSPTAVSLQAIIEEFRGEIHRADQSMTAFQKAFEEQTAKLVAERERSAGLIEELAAKDKENADLHDQYLKMNSVHDEERAKKMESFYKVLREKGDKLEAAWEQRHKELENDYAQRAAELQKSHEATYEALRKRASEMEAQFAKEAKDLAASHDKMMREMKEWEERNRIKDASLLGWENELSAKERQLKEEYNRKSLEIESVKETLQREVSEIVKQYQAKQRHDESQGTGAKR